MSDPTTTTGEKKKERKNASSVQIRDGKKDKGNAQFFILTYLVYPLAVLTSS